MVKIQTVNLSPMQLGRLNKALDTKYRYDGEVRTLREQLATLEGIKREWDGMSDWSRTHFNRLDGKAQREYEARLKAKRYYSIDGWQVPKIVYDVIQ